MSTKVITESEREAFRRGFAFGVEGMIEAHDPLLRLLAILSTLVEIVASDFDAEELERLPAIVDAKVEAAMSEVGRLRLGEGEAEALKLWALERALP